MAPYLRPFLRAVGAFPVLIGLNILWAARREGSAARDHRAGRSAWSFAIADAAMAHRPRIVGMLFSGPSRAPHGGCRWACRCSSLGTFPLFALAALIQSYRAANAEEKRQVAWPLWGLLLAVGAKVLAVIADGALSLWLAFTQPRHDRVARRVPDARHRPAAASRWRSRSRSPWRSSSTG